MAGSSLDEGTKKYLEERFNNIDKMFQSFIASLKKTDDKVEKHSDMLSNLKTEVHSLKEFKHDHMKTHDDKKDTNRFSMKQIIAVIAIICSVIIAAFIK